MSFFRRGFRLDIPRDVPCLLPTAAGFSAKPRQLHNWAARNREAPAQQLVIGGASTLFGVLQTLKKAPQAHKKIIYVSDGSWLDHIHTAHMENKWGQRKAAFHPELQVAIPALKETDFLRWEHMRQIQEYVYRLAQQYGAQLEIIKDKVTDITQGSDGNITVALERSKPLALSSDSHIYNFARTSNTPAVPVFNPQTRTIEYVPSVAHESLYSLDPKQIPQTVVSLGRGLSFLWILYYLRPENAVVLRKENSAWTIAPRSNQLNLDSITDLTLPSTPLQDKEMLLKAGHFYAEKTPEGHIQFYYRDKVGQVVSTTVDTIYATAGVRTNHELTSKLDPELVTVHQEFSAVQPKDQPKGNFVDRFYDYLMSTGNVHAQGFLFSYWNAGLQDDFRKLCTHAGVRIFHSKTFFTELKHKIEGLSETPTKEALITMMKDTFLDTHRYKGHREVAAWERIENELRTLSNVSRQTLRP